MSLTVQQLRTTTATQVPAGLEPGQIALNLANGWFIVGDGGNGVSVAGAPVAAGAATVFGVAGVTIPTVTAGKGYEIYELKNPPASVRIFSVLCGSSVLLVLNLMVLVQVHFLSVSLTSLLVALLVLLLKLKLLVIYVLEILLSSLLVLLALLLVAMCGTVLAGF